MRKRETLILLISFLTAGKVVAQTAVTTAGGTLNEVPVFTGTSTIGNSDISVSNGALTIAYPTTITPFPYAPAEVTISPDANMAINVSTDQTGGNAIVKAVNGIAKPNIGQPTLSESRIEGVYGEGDTYGNPLTGYVAGVEARGVSNGTASGATVPAVYGAMGIVMETSSGAMTNAYGLYSQVNAAYNPQSTGVISNAYGVYVDTIASNTITGGGGTQTQNVTNAYSLYLKSPNSSIPTSYGLYQAGTAKNYFAGNVGIGTTSPVALLEVNGTAQVDGVLNVGNSGIVFPNSGGTQTTAWTGVLCGGDYAESVDVSTDRRAYQPGDVLVIATGEKGDVEKSAEPYSTMVAGIFATKPGVIGRRQTTPKTDDEVPMAMIGIVPTKVSAENGPVKRGDLLVTSSTLGYAMKGTDRGRMLGAVLGKAMGSLDSGSGVIEVLVTLQ